MDIENIMQSNNKRLLKGLLLAVLAVALIFYFIAFFAKGAEFDDTFLKKEVVSADAHYMGKNMYGSIHITVKGIKDVPRVLIWFCLPGTAEDIMGRIPGNSSISNDSCDLVSEF